MPSTNDQQQPPPWTSSAHRLDRPKIDVWYKPEEHAALDGFLVWQGQEEHRMSGETYHAFAIKEAETGKMFGVTERAALRFLRHVRPGSRVYIRPIGKKDLGDGRSMWEFETYAQEVDYSGPAAGGAAPRPSNGKGGAQPPVDAAGGNSNDGIPF
jgi:hypothetical protein